MLPDMKCQERTKTKRQRDSRRISFRSCRLKRTAALSTAVTVEPLIHTHLWALSPLPRHQVTQTLVNPWRRLGTATLNGAPSDVK